MKNRNQATLIVSVIVAGLILIALLITLPQSAQERVQETDLSQFPVADYDAAESGNREEREKRKEKNNRYDKMNLVSKNPNPKTSGATLFDETPSPPAIPVNESEVVIIGEVLNAEAYVSNDKGGVYSEFTVRVEKVFKNNEPQHLEQDSQITIDRTGGWVRYPNGQKVFYIIAGKELPLIRKRYVFFLTNADKSLNYNILTGYELKNNKVFSLDKIPRFEKFDGIGETDFTATIWDAIAKPAQKVINQ